MGMSSNLSFVLALLSAFCYLVSAFPRPQASNGGDLVTPQSSRNCGNNKIKSTLHTANFDDLPAEDNPRTQVPEPYEDLYYKAFFVESYLKEHFIIPATGNQYTISYDYRNAEISAIYPGSTVKSFDLKSFSYACDQGVPQAECNILVTGVRAFRHDGTTKTVTQTVMYPALVPPVDPSSLTMKKATFGSQWRGLQSISFALVQDGQASNYAGLVLDAVEYITSDCSGY
ncbi:MAG: hypothetical protein M1830_004510 [Pleopsidium flavum]|nr:MAG: hypothetical protein M1830_004510 [Pleopsidium flavum]